MAGLLATVVACSRSAPDAFERGLAYYREDKFAKAAGYFEQAVTSGTPTAQAWNFLGVCHLHSGNTNGAVHAFEETLKLDPGHAAAKYNLALAYIESHQIEPAIPLLRQLTQTAQCPPSVHYQLGRALVQSAAWLPAKQALNKLHDADTNADVQNMLGVIETRLGNFKQAKHHFESAAQIDPAVPAPTLNLAVLEHHYLGQKSAAVEHYQKFLDQTPKTEQREDIRLTIAQLTQETQKPVEPPAPKVAPPAPAPPPKPVAPVETPVVEPKPAPVAVAPPPKPTVKRRTPVVVGSLRAGDRTKARADFNEGVKQQQLGKTAAAVTAYTRAITTDPAYGQAYYNLGIAAVELNQPEKALEYYEYALAADPDFSNARYNYAIILQKQGYLADAVAQYERLLVKTPQDASLHLIVASLYARDPQAKDKARQHYQAVQRLTPNTPAGRDARDWLQKNP
ncbi:MAG: Lipopolysaccharide assembly protein B [Verrucomicrobiae bacterium]|nr:Lipopolysaccharide assembly protein B [Verrucomicrobiae bacterium]